MNIVKAGSNSTTVCYAELRINLYSINKNKGISDVFLRKLYEWKGIQRNLFKQKVNIEQAVSNNTTLGIAELQEYYIYSI